MGRRGLRAWCVSALVALCLAVPGAAAASPAEGTSSGGLYIALGDSYAAGTGATPDHSYVDLLFAHYRSTLGVTDHSVWIGGTSGHLRDPSDHSFGPGGQLFDALAEINSASDTRVVTIDNGGHDAMAGCDFTSPTCAFRKNFSATLADLQGALANDPGEEPLIAMAYFNPWVGEPMEAEGDRLLLGNPPELNCADTGAELGLNDIIAQEAGKHDALLANPYPAFRAAGQAYMGPFPGDVHPNDAGYAAVAAAFINAEPACPSNEFRFKKVKRNESKGTAKLTVKVPGPGELELAKARTVKGDDQQAEEAGKEKLLVKARGKAKRKLAKKGKAKVKARVTYIPEGEGIEPNTETKKVKLVKR